MRELREPVALLERTRADDDARCAGSQQVLDTVVRAHAAADLHRHVRLGQHVANQREVRPVARSRIEVHQVQSMEPVMLPVAHHVDRVA